MTCFTNRSVHILPLPPHAGIRQHTSAYVEEYTYCRCLRITPPRPSAQELGAQVGTALITYAASRVSIRQHTSAYGAFGAQVGTALITYAASRVSTRQHMSAYGAFGAQVGTGLITYAASRVSIRQHTELLERK
jgi:hypothetical protein